MNRAWGANSALLADADDHARMAEVQGRPISARLFRDLAAKIREQNETIVELRNELRKFRPPKRKARSPGDAR
jgi:hypothetical protein